MRASLALVGAMSCGGPEALSGPDAFAGSATSLAELADRVVSALTARDTASLNGLRLTMTEHNEVVWPELPAARPEVNFPVDFAWTNIQLRNRRALARLFPRLVGRAAEVDAVRRRGEVRTFETFRVHTDCWVRFRTAHGDEIEAQLFKDVLERGGGFKIFRYYEEPYRVSAEAQGEDEAGGESAAEPREAASRGVGT